MARASKPTGGDPGPQDQQAPDEEHATWRDRAVERSLTAARAQALARSSRFIAAAMELLQATGNVDFTVQNIVEESQLSLRAFYQHFGGKDELLLALYEEFLSQFANDMRQDIPDDADPLEKLEIYVRGFVARISGGDHHGARALNIYTNRLAVDHPEDYRRALTPQLQLLGSIVREGVDSGAFRSDLPATVTTLMLHSTLVSALQIDLFGMSTAGTPLGAEELWSWCRAAVQPMR